jgi:transcriptional regulator with XRE-family HTH domain
MTGAAPRPRAPDPLDVSIGLRVRALRLERGLTLQEVGRRAGLSIGFLSQLERGLSSPAVRDLMRIAEALGSDFNLLLAQGAAGAPAGGATTPVLRLHERRDIAFVDGVLKQILSPPDEQTLFLYMVTLEPHGQAGTAPYSHAGEEAGLVLQGRLVLSVDGTDHLLNEGDSFRFRSTTPHHFSNPTGAVTRVLWVNVKPKREDN